MFSLAFGAQDSRLEFRAVSFVSFKHPFIAMPPLDRWITAAVVEN